MSYQHARAALVSSSAEPVAEVDPAHLGIGEDFVRGALEEHLAGVDDRGPVDDVEGLAYIVVGDQNADPASPQIADYFADVGDRQGVDAGEGFVEEHER